MQAKYSSPCGIEIFRMNRLLSSVKDTPNTSLQINLSLSFYIQRMCMPVACLLFATEFHNFASTPSVSLFRMMMTTGTKSKKYKMNAQVRVCILTSM